MRTHLCIRLCGFLPGQRRHLGGLGAVAPQGKRKKDKKKEKKKKRGRKREKWEKRKKGTMNSVKLLHIKCCFFQFFNSPVALEMKKICLPQEKVEMTPLSQANPHKLQRIQNTLAKLVCQDHNSPDALSFLHWLPIRQRIDFKIKLPFGIRTFEFWLPYSLIAYCLKTHSPACMLVLYVCALKDYAAFSKTSCQNRHRLLKSLLLQSGTFMSHHVRLSHSVYIYKRELWTYFSQ